MITVHCPRCGADVEVKPCVESVSREARYITAVFDAPRVAHVCKDVEEKNAGWID